MKGDSEKPRVPYLGRRLWYIVGLVALLVTLVFYPLGGALAGAVVLLFLLIRLPKRDVDGGFEEAWRRPRLLSRLSFHGRKMIGIWVLASLLLLLLPTLGVVEAAGVGIAKLRVCPVGTACNPEVDDTYVGDDPDPWITDSWVITVTGDFASFGLRIVNRHSSQAYDLNLRVAINDASLLNSISLEIIQGDNVGDSEVFGPRDFGIGTPTLSNGKLFPGHGVYPTAFASFGIGGAGPLGDPTNTVIIGIAVDGAFTEGLKVHFDADGWTLLPDDDDDGPDSDDIQVILNDEGGETNVRNPNSADTTVEIPTFLDIAFPVVGATIVILLINRRLRPRVKE